MKKRIFALFFCAFLVFALASVCFADEIATDVAAITGALSDFSSGNIITVLVAALGVSVPLILVWFAFRKIFNWAKGAFFHG